MSASKDIKNAGADNLQVLPPTSRFYCNSPVDDSWSLECLHLTAKHHPVLRFSSLLDSCLPPCDDLIMKLRGEEARRIGSMGH